ncbi:MAG: 50S ribosomal protein L4 [Planctomycetia bacterium]|nr:50S ribosomal protein L4 [Planctomycetia bacterium]
MPSIPIFDRTGKEVGAYDIAPEDLAPRINKQLLHDAVVMYQANLRQGTFKTKSRTEVAGTTKKMYRQKGTGNARAGSRRSNIRRGGGHAKQKRPRDFGYRLPRKALQLATRMALASKLRDNQVVVIDQLSLAAPRTKDVAGVLRALKLNDTTLLLATAAYDANVYKSARNIEGVKVSAVADLNALCLLQSRKLLVTKDALDAFKARVPAAKQA